MDLKAQYLLETCSDPIGFLNQLRQTTEPIGGGIVYTEDGELVEYEVAIEAVKKANDAFIEKAKSWFERQNEWFDPDGNRHCDMESFEDFKKYMEGDKV